MRHRRRSIHLPRGQYFPLQSLTQRSKPVSAAPLPPAPRHPIRSQDKGVRLRRKPMRALSKYQHADPIHNLEIGNINIQWRWITESLPQLTTGSVLWRKVELLKELWRDGDTSGGPDSLECCTRIMIFIEMLVATHVAVAVREVLLEWPITVIVCSRLKWSVIVHCRHSGYSLIALTRTRTVQANALV